MNTHSKVKFFVGTLVAVMITALNGYAGSVVTLQGRILTPAGDPLAEAGVKIRVQVLTPNANECILFDETHTVDMSATEGLFSIGINDGLGTRNDTNVWSFSNAISNASAKTVNSNHCSTGSGSITYTPSSTDERKVAVFFQRAGSASWEEMTDSSGRPYLTHAPYAMETNSIAGFGSDNLCRVANAGVPQSVPALSSTEFSELQSLAAGTSSKYLKSSATEGTTLPVLTTNPTTLVAGKIWYEGGALKYYDAANSTVRIIGTTTSGVTNGTQAGAVSIGSSDASNLTLKTNGSARMTIDSAGKVGIGTASPVEALTVAGKITGGSQMATHRNTLDLSSSAGTSADISLEMDSGSSPVSVLASKQNSVGTGDVMLQSTPLATGYGILETWAGLGTIVGTGNNTPVIIRPNRAEAVRITGDGKVGIGTNAPAEKLSVNGVIQSTSGGIKFPDNTVQTTAFTGMTSRHLVVVTYPFDAGSSTGGLNLSAGAFTKCSFSTVDSDAGGNWSVANNWYVVPETGSYQIITKLRVNDNVGAHSFGQGAGTTAADNADFAWFTTSATGTPSRNGSMNIRIMTLNAGDKIIMYYYLDGFTARGQLSMTIFKM